MPLFEHLWGGNYQNYDRKMNDFRAELYKNYVSGFKSKIASYDEREIQTHWQWSDHKYLPHLKNYPETAEILEIGCGPGFFLDYLENRGYKNALGIDFSEEQIQFAVKRGVNAKTGNALDYLKEHTGAFDVIIAFDFIEHFTKDELISLSRDIFAALKPCGMLLLHTPNGQGFFPNRIIYGDLTHLTIFSPNSVRQLFHAAGFSKVEVFETGPVPKNLKGRIRMIGWKFMKIALNMLKMIETGGGLDIWTQDMIAVCRKNPAQG